MTSRVSAKEARENFSDLLGRVFYGKEAVIVEKKGRPFAVLINPDQYERFLKDQDYHFWETVHRIQALNADKDPDEVYADITEIVEEVRRERYEQRAGNK